jgi:hypothetical protein
MASSSQQHDAGGNGNYGVWASWVGVVLLQAKWLWCASMSTHSSASRLAEIGLHLTPIHIRRRRQHSQRAP